MSARDDTKDALMGNVRFVVEAIGNGDLEPLAKAYIANIAFGRDSAWYALVDIVEDYAEHAIEQALEQNTRGDNLDALNKLEDAYRDKPNPNEVQPLFTDIFKRARMQP